MWRHCPPESDTRLGDLEAPEDRPTAFSVVVSVFVVLLKIVDGPAGPSSLPILLLSSIELVPIDWGLTRLALPPHTFTVTGWGCRHGADPLPERAALGPPLQIFEKSECSCLMSDVQ